MARALVSRATHTIGLVVGDIDNPFFAAAARGLSDVVDVARLHLLLANADEDPERERRAIRALGRGRVDGLVVVPAPGAGSQLVRGTPPLVQLDRAVRGARRRCGDGAKRCRARPAPSHHLLGLGHRRIGIVSDPPAITSSAERIAGYRRALRAARDGWTSAGLDRRLHPGRGPSRRRWRCSDRPDRPTAVFTANNFMTHGVAAGGAPSSGLRIPGDLALVGFDDLDWTTLVKPPLTVVSQPVTELGRVAGERLLRRIGGEDGPPRRIRLRDPADRARLLRSGAMSDVVGAAGSSWSRPTPPTPRWSPGRCRRGRGGGRCWPSGCVAPGSRWTCGMRRRAGPTWSDGWPAAAAGAR